jgi:hypothetical protein
MQMSRHDRDTYTGARYFSTRATVSNASKMRLFHPQVNRITVRTPTKQSLSADCMESYRHLTTNRSTQIATSYIVVDRALPAHKTTPISPKHICKATTVAAKPPPSTLDSNVVMLADEKTYQKAKSAKPRAIRAKKTCDDTCFRFEKVVFNVDLTMSSLLLYYAFCFETIESATVITREQTALTTILTSLGDD